MATLDPRLESLMRASNERAATRGRFIAAQSDTGQSPMVEVLVRLRNQAGGEEAEVAALLKLGMRMRATVRGTYTVISGEIPIDSLPALQRMDGVRRVEASRQLTPELDLCVPEVGAHVLHSAHPAIRGAGTLIGVIDTGIDFRHPDFINPDGSSRIYRLWDQNAAPVHGSSVYYGREYTREQITAALRGLTPATDCVPIDPDGHGTHVCGIAAGSGRARPTHVGLAPEAELIVVALSDGDISTLGRSVRAFEAFNYVVERAAGKPVAINFSQGMNGGGHCGETVLETGIDNLARLPNVVIIKSAGNEQLMRIHAGGTLRSGETREVLLEVSENDELDDVMEIWFADDDDISVALRPPGEEASPFLVRGVNHVFKTNAGNNVSINIEMDAEGTGDTATTLILSRGSASMIKPGHWTLLLRAGTVVDGRFDAWIERTVRPGGEQTRFAQGSHDPTRTISIPGTARNVITVGAYVTRPGLYSKRTAGSMATSSSRGPTRYGQYKPDLVAPGEVMESAGVGTRGTVRKCGTSMAAAVVTGAAALIMSQRSGLTCGQLKQILTRTARIDGTSENLPDNVWGYGKLDVQAAIELAAKAQFPVITNVRVEGLTISWETDITTTGSVRFLPNRRQLLLGKLPHIVNDSKLSNSHQVTLPELSAGKYFCQIVAFSAERFFTEDDNDGDCYEVNMGEGVCDPVDGLALGKVVPAKPVQRNPRP